MLVEVISKNVADTKAYDEPEDEPTHHLSVFYHVVLVSLVLYTQGSRGILVRSARLRRVDEQVDFQF